MGRALGQQDPSIPSVSDALRSFHVMAVEYHASVPAEGSGAMADPLPMAAVVHHRESLMGCHSFERFLSPRWETLLVFEDTFAHTWRLENAIRSTPTRGAHLLKLNVSAGEWLARAIALRRMDELNRRPPLLLSSQCDMQPLPPWHVLHTPYAVLVERLTVAFLAEARARAIGTTAAVPLSDTDLRLADRSAIAHSRRCAAVFKRNDRSLFVMNTPIFETIPHAATLEGARFHSVDVGQWQRHSVGGARPRGPMTGTTGAWLSDVSTWVEDHAVLYNTTLLSDVVDVWQRAGATLSAGVKLIPSHMCTAGLSAVRHNDIHLFYDRAWPSLTADGGVGGGSIPLTNMSHYAAADVDRLRWYNLRLLSDFASPLGCFREFMAIRKHTGHRVQIACLIPQRHLHPSHLPSARFPDEARKLLSMLLKLLGFGPVASTATADFFWRLPLWHAYNAAWSQPRGVELQNQKRIGRLVALQDLSTDDPALELRVTELQQAQGSRFCRAPLIRGGPRKLLQWSSTPVPADSRQDTPPTDTHTIPFPPPQEVLRLNTSTWPRGMTYPAIGWAVKELTVKQATQLSETICKSLVWLRSTSARSDRWYQLPHYGPRLKVASLWHRVFSSLEQLC